MTIEATPRGPAPTRVPIALDERSYDILIGTALLDEAGTWAGLPASSDALIVTNTTVEPLYAARLARQLAARHGRVLQVALPDGEAHKDWQNLNLIFDELLASGCDRKTGYSLR